MASRRNHVISNKSQNFDDDKDTESWVDIDFDREMRNSLEQLETAAEVGELKPTDSDAILASKSTHTIGEEPELFLFNESFESNLIKFQRELHDINFTYDINNSTGDYVSLNAVSVNEAENETECMNYLNSFKQDHDFDANTYFDEFEIDNDEFEIGVAQAFSSNTATSVTNAEYIEDSTERFLNDLTNLSSTINANNTLKADADQDDKNSCNNTEQDQSFLTQLNDSESISFCHCKDTRLTKSDSKLTSKPRMKQTIRVGVLGFQLNSCNNLTSNSISSCLSTSSSSHASSTLTLKSSASSSKSPNKQSTKLAHLKNAFRLFKLGATQTRNLKKFTERSNMIKSHSFNNYGEYVVDDSPASTSTASGHVCSVKPKRFRTKFERVKFAKKFYQRRQRTSSFIKNEYLAARIRKLNQINLNRSVSSAALMNKMNAIAAYGNNCIVAKAEPASVSGASFSAIKSYKPSFKVEKLLNDSRGMRKYLIDYDNLMSSKNKPGVSNSFSANNIFNANPALLKKFRSSSFISQFSNLVGDKESTITFTSLFTTNRKDESNDLCSVSAFTAPTSDILALSVADATHDNSVFSASTHSIMTKNLEDNTFLQSSSGYFNELKNSTFLDELAEFEDNGIDCIDEQELTQDFLDDDEPLAHMREEDENNVDDYDDENLFDFRFTSQTENETENSNSDVLVFNLKREKYSNYRLRFSSQNRCSSGYLSDF